MPSLSTRRRPDAAPPAERDAPASQASEVSNAALAEYLAEQERPEVSGLLGRALEDHLQILPELDLTTSKAQEAELAQFEASWGDNQERYAGVSAQAGIPPELIAALHWRESSGDFGTYLHQGDPLGKPPRHEPKDIPTFDEWDEAAVHALGMKGSIRDELGIDAETDDPALLATFAEAYNGFGYEQRGIESPYVYAGTDAYTRGRYVADGQFSASSVDQRPGVMAMMARIGGFAHSDEVGPLTPETAWHDVSRGQTLLRTGSRGPAVEALQQRLADAGYAVGPIDGAFGPGTQRALQAFQRDHGLQVDGVAGRGTAGAFAPATPAPGPATAPAPR